MFFILSKILLYLLLPMLWIVGVILYACFTRNQKKRRKSFILATVMLFFFGNAYLVNEVFTLWEKPAIPIASLNTYDTAIVLTGIADPEKELNDRVYIGSGADRVLHTVQLYKLGKVRKILISGGSGAPYGKIVPEAAQLKKVFIYCGVPEEDIIIENSSRNTHESAQFTKKLVDSLGRKGNYLLITSAFHMRRAQGCFTKAGLATDIFPVDFYSGDRQLDIDQFLPTEGAISNWSTLIHEITGYVVYKLMGYC